VAWAFEVEEVGCGNAKDVGKVGAAVVFVVLSGLRVVCCVKSNTWAG